MGLFSGFGQCVLVILNIIFVLVSLILLIVGIILKFFPGVLLQFLFDGLKDVTHFEIPDGSSSLDTVPLLDDLGMAALIFGLVLFAVAFLACCGACCKWRILLGAFCVCVVILVLAIAVVGGLFLSPGSSMHTKFKGELSKEVKKDYKGPENKDVFSLLVNILSYSLECCAMDGPNDFNSSAKWTNYNSGGQTIHIDVTPACCNHTYLTRNDLTCAMKSVPLGTFDPKKTNIEGCYDKILDLVKQHQSYAIAIIIVLIALLILELIFAIVIIRSESDVGPL